MKRYFSRSGSKTLPCEHSVRRRHACAGSGVPEAGGRGLPEQCATGASRLAAAAGTAAAIAAATAAATAAVAAVGGEGILVLLRWAAALAGYSRPLWVQTAGALVSESSGRIERCQGASGRMHGVLQTRCCVERSCTELGRGFLLPPCRRDGPNAPLLGLIG